jgi:CDP-diacylglycerol--serine O-phosphatidyltransferase
VKLFTLANFLTLGNLLCGTLGINAVIAHGDYKMAAYLTGLALLLDFFDGFVARLMKDGSDLGKELDSLADVVSFGVLPGVVLWKYMEQVAYLPENVAYLGLAIPLFSALRLAKFNIDTRQSMSFIGLPTPANAMVIAVLPLLASVSPTLSDFISNSWFIPGYVVIFCYLLIAEIPLPALKFKNYSWSDNKFTYTLLILSVILLSLIKLAAIPVIVFAYITYSIIQYIRKS